jgi:ASTRA-associated protein 1
MAMTLSNDYEMALSVSADHLVGKYMVFVRHFIIFVISRLMLNLLNKQDLCDEKKKKEIEPIRTKHPGSSAVALRDDTRVCAIGGWDSKYDLFFPTSLINVSMTEIQNTIVLDKIVQLTRNAIIS